MGAADVVVVRTGTANLASIVAGLERVGASPRISEDPSEVEEARRVVLPGVGTLAAAMERLAARGLVEPLRERIGAGRPTLAVCLGLQLLCQTSEESPGLEALGVIPGRVTRFAEGLRVSQLGWNRIVPDAGARLLEEGYVYFANSYCLREAPDGWHAALCDYGGPFVAAVERGAVLACQFHPELSSAFGLGLIRRWLAIADEEGGVPC
jgi:imidazole glycerol phosphate synthase glutamine amidotransferase subunit